MKEILGMNLTEILKSAVRESVDSLMGDEKLKQKKVASSMKPFKAAKKSKSSPETSDVDENEDGLDSNNDGLQQPVAPKKDDLPEITLSVIIDLIGAIRAGQSLKEKDVLANLKGYYDRLNGNERVALYAFLTGISKVMQNIDEPTAAGPKVATPTGEPFKIQMKKDTPKPDDSPAKGEEAPIVVGEVASKSREKAILKGNLK